MAAGVVGKVIALWRYPVKSMAGEALPQAAISWHGIAGDRRWAFVRDDAVATGFPWLTLRERADLSRYVPSFVEPEQPDRSATRVNSPSGQLYDVVDPRLAAELSSTPVRVIRQDRGVFDTFPLSLITTQTIAELGRRVAMPLVVERFRPNLVVEAATGEPFVEDEWVGRTLRIGGVRLRVDKRDGRCAVITIDPVTGERAPEILRAVVRDRGGCLGVYATTVEPGTVALGDAVGVESDGVPS
jgi:uncharacterized protein YcbX